MRNEPFNPLPVLMASKDLINSNLHYSLFDAENLNSSQIKTNGSRNFYLSLIAGRQKLNYRRLLSSGTVILQVGMGLRTTFEYMVTQMVKSLDVLVP